MTESRTTGAPAPVLNEFTHSATDAAAIGHRGLSDAMVLLGAIEELSTDETVKGLARLGFQRADQCRDEIEVLRKEMEEAISSLRSVGGGQ